MEYEGKTLEILTSTQENGKFAGIIRDITGRVRAEQALQESEEKYRTLFERESDAIFIYDPDTTNIIEANETTSKMYGYDNNELIGMSCLKFSVEVEESASAIDKIRENGEVNVPHRYHQKKDGTVFPVDVSGYAITLGGKNVMFAVSKDISERMQIEDRIARFGHIFEESLNEIYLFDTNTLKFTQVNRAAQKNLGYTMEELQALTPLDLKPEYTAKSFAKLVAPVRKGEKEKIVFKTVHKRKDQSLYDVEVHLQLLKYEKSALFAAIILDITDRKAAEAAVRGSEARYRQLFEEMTDGFSLHEIICDKDGQPVDYRFLEVNPGFEKLTGIKAENIIGRTVLEVLPNTEPIWIEKAGQVALTGEPVSFESFSQEFNRYYSLKAYCPERGKFAAIFEDVTARREVEKRIQESEKDYRSLFEHVPDGVYRSTLAGKYLAVNPAFATMLGFDPEKELKDYSVTDFYADPMDREDFIEQMTTNNVVTNLEIRMKRSDGQIVDCLENARTIRDDQGNILCFEGTLTDVSDRKRAAQALEIYTGQLETLNTISTALTSSLELDEVLELILDQIGKVMPLDSGAVFLYEGGELRVVVDRGITPSVKGSVFPIESELFSEIQRSGEPLILENAQDDPRFQSWGDAINVMGWMGVPLIIRDTLIGFFTLDSFEPASYTPEHARLSQSFAAQAAQAIENARHFSTAQRRLERLASLRDIDQAITSSLDLRVTMSILLGHIVQRLEVDAAAILLHRQDQKILEYVAGEGFRTKVIQSTNMRLGQGSAGVAALERRTVQVSDLEQLNTGILRSPEFRLEGFVSYIGLPLIAKGVVVGVMEIYHRHPINYDPEWMEFLEILARQAAIAIDNISLFTDLQRSNAELIQAYDATIEGWAQALELRDMEAEGHSRKVVDLTIKLARNLGIKGKQLMDVRRGALLHDIGKMGVPDSILRKKEKLTKEEWQSMSQHPVYAYDWLSSIQYLKPALDIPYCHHEKWDGSGYPRGLKREQIPIAARIFAVVDVWEALISDRPYKKAWPKDEALKYLREQAGIHFDPQVVDAFMEIKRPLV